VVFPAGLFSERMNSTWAALSSGESRGWFSSVAALVLRGLSASKFQRVLAASLTGAVMTRNRLGSNQFRFGLSDARSLAFLDKSPQSFVGDVDLALFQ
jgi:hypothetical protein